MYISYSFVYFQVPDHFGEWWCWCSINLRETTMPYTDCCSSLWPGFLAFTHVSELYLWEWFLKNVNLIVPLPLLKIFVWLPPKSKKSRHLFSDACMASCDLALGPSPHLPHFPPLLLLLPVVSCCSSNTFLWTFSSEVWAPGISWHAFSAWLSPSFPAGLFFTFQHLMSTQFNSVLCLPVFPSLSYFFF